MQTNLHLAGSMGDSYSTLEGAQVSLGRLTAEERRFLGQMIGHFKMGGSYLDFENLYMDPDSVVFRHAVRLGKSVAETPLYRVCDDLARRLGIRQGYLVREQVFRHSEPEAAERRELTTGEVAKLANCTHEAVRKAIRTGRLRARRVGRLSHIWDQDARAFSEARRQKRGGRSLDKKGSGHLTRQRRRWLPESSGEQNFFGPVRPAAGGPEDAPLEEETGGLPGGIGGLAQHPRIGTQIGTKCPDSRPAAG